MAEARSQWKSRLGFILAASGSAIGLGNIVFFPANAYKYGGGAFYVPYLVALFLIGIPLMITEFGLGGMTRKSFPLAMRQAAGRFGEFFGWFAILNAAFISMYYITILGWVLGMGIEGLQGDVATTFKGTSQIEWLGENGAELANPKGTFFNMISSATPMVAVFVVWVLNFLLVSRGTKTIEVAVKIFVPLMWIAMIVLIVRGVTLPGGFDGVKTLFTPRAEVLSDPVVWQGAMAQMFFTLTLGFGVMTAYASYLPQESDHAHNAITTSLLNCGFEWIAGVAIFSMLFAFSIAPQASTLGMMFFIVPRGIAELPLGAQVFSVGFFGLLLIAGLTSSISLVEAVVVAAQDKFKMPRLKTLMICGTVGMLGSLAFALPMVVNNRPESPGTLGFTLLDLIDHWAFSYGLLIAGFFECLIIGWGIGSQKIRRYVNEHSRFKLGIWFDVLIRVVIPAIIASIIAFNIYTKEWSEELYGAGSADKFTALEFVMKYSHIVALVVWILGCTVTAFFLTRANIVPPSRPQAIEVGPQGGAQ